MITFAIFFLWKIHKYSIPKFLQAPCFVYWSFHLRLQRWNILFFMNKEKFMSNIHLQQHNFVRLIYSYLDCRGYLESEVGSFSVGSCSQTAEKRYYKRTNLNYCSHINVCNCLIIHILSILNTYIVNYLWRDFPGVL